MKAAVCREFGAPLIIEEVTLEPAGPGEVHVKLAVCASANCHSDHNSVDGGWGGSWSVVCGHEALRNVIIF